MMMMFVLVGSAMNVVGHVHLVGVHVVDHANHADQWVGMTTDVMFILKIRPIQQGNARFRSSKTRLQRLQVKRRDFVAMP